MYRAADIFEQNISLFLLCMPIPANTIQNGHTRMGTKQSPYTGSSISEVHTMSELVGEQYWGPFIQWPNDVNMHLAY